LEVKDKTEINLYKIDQKRYASKKDNNQPSGEPWKTKKKKKLMDE